MDFIDWIKDQAKAVTNFITRITDVNDNGELDRDDIDVISQSPLVAAVELIGDAVEDIQAAREAEKYENRMHEALETEQPFMLHEGGHGAALPREWDQSHNENRLEDAIRELRQNEPVPPLHYEDRGPDGSAPKQWNNHSTSTETTLWR